MPVSHFWGSIYRNILPSLTQLVAHLSVIYHRPTRSTGPPVISSQTTTFGKIQAKGLFCFFFSRATPRSTWFCKWRKSASNLDKKWDREGGVASVGGLCEKFLLAAANLGAQWPLFGCMRRRVRAADNISPAATEKKNFSALSHWVGTDDISLTEAC